MTAGRIVGVTMANRRRDRRVMMPEVQVMLEGEMFLTDDWSLGGFSVAPYEGSLVPGDLVTVEILIAVEDDTFTVSAEAEVVRVETDMARLAARFTALDPEAVHVLEGAATGRLRRLARK